MGQTLKSILSFFRAITSDATANTLAISAMSMIPLMGLVGGSVDASRYYMTETRIQQACDAGALAARRAMADDTAFEVVVDGTNQTPKQMGEAFFEENFPEGTFGLEELEYEYTVTDEGEVVGIATGTLPASIMFAFGFETFEVGVTCTSDINISNTDIMFVIDITGSMNCAPDNPGGGNCGNTPDPGAKIDGLRDAMMLFFDTVEGATSDTAQVRYGVVPYASNVNVGGVIMAANPGWMAQEHTYQSRRWEVVLGDWEETGTTYTRYSGANTWEPQDTWSETVNFSSLAGCQDYVNNNSYIDSFVDSDVDTWELISVSSTNPRTTEYDGDVRFELRRITDGTYYGSTGNCELDWELVWYLADATIRVSEEREEFGEWVYEPVTFDISGVYDDGTVQLPLGNEGSMRDVDWDGCVEEANTVNVANFDPVPAGANDLNINLVPSNANEFWKPVLRDAVWERRDGTDLDTSTETWTNQGNRVLRAVRDSERVNSEGEQVGQSRTPYDCTTPAFRLQEMERADMQTFVNGLAARGNTYHDIGMIWGARLISPRGIFADDNEAAPNGDAIARHIVFMTDGLLVPNIETYGMYGTEWWDRRVTEDGSGGQANARHAARFQAACRAARRENISVWVVAFGTTLTQNLIDCATPGRAFTAADSAALQTQFQQIAQQIAALRLTN